MIDRKTYLTLPGDYKTLKSDFWEPWRQAEKMYWCSPTASH